MPTKRPFLRKPWVRWIFWCLLIVSALISLFHAFENWRGARVWERARATYETDERSLSWETLLPNKLVEDEDNFFAIPLLRDLRAPSSPTADAKRNRLTGPTLDKLTREQRTALSKARDFENGKPIDYVIFREALGSPGGIPLPADEPDPARAVLRGIEEAIDWLPITDAASGRHQAQLLPLAIDHFDQTRPWLTEWAHLSPIRSMARWLGYRASAAIHCGEKDTARVSIATSFHLVRGMYGEGTMMEQLGAISMTSILMRPIWDSLHERLWHDAELQWLASELARLDAVSNYHRALKTEAAYGIVGLEYLKDIPMSDYQQFQGIETESDRLATLRLSLKRSLCPDGWIDQEKALHLKTLARLQDAVHSRNFKTVISEIDALHGAGELSTLLPTQRRFFLSVALTQAHIHQARIAVALERHYLAHQAYPPSLEALVPDCIGALPPDPMGGTWRYVPSPELQDYHLYSVGWNLVDDGGTPAIPAKREEGDFVWFR